MSEIDEAKTQSENQAVSNSITPQVQLKPLYQLFTAKLLSLVFTVMVMMALIAALFYQSNVQNNLLIENQLIPLTQQFNKVTALQKSEELVNKLLVAENVASYVQLHSQLIASDRQLLLLNNSNVQLFQQWLNEHKSAEDIVSRIQDSDTRNQQLKQSSIIQLQLMLFSITPIIDEKIASQKLLSSQSQAKALVETVQQISELQKLQTLLAEILASFEQLTMYTPIENFELLRFKVEQALAHSKQLKNNGNINAMADVYQQIDAFEKIVITEQRALAKWQGYIRLAQDYHANLKAQQQQISQLLLTPYTPRKTSNVSAIQAALTQFNIQLSEQKIAFILAVGIVLSFFVFCYLLWQLREQIRFRAQQSVVIIQRALQKSEQSVAMANCMETQEILKQLQSIAKPEHNEQEFQKLSHQHQSSLQLIEQKEQVIAELEQSNEQQQFDSKEQVADIYNRELQRYQHLADVALPLVQQQQAIVFKSKALLGNDNIYQTTEITALYQQLRLFYLAQETQLNNSVLSLIDINLVDEIHAVLFNKQPQLQRYNSELFFSFDEQLLSQAKVDFRLFQQLINLFLDILLEASLSSLKDKSQASQLHFHLQVHDKSAGQQQVRFIIKVKQASIEILPDIVNQLLESQSSTRTTFALVDIFKLLFTKQHGENIVAQIMDDGYQVSFDLPLALADNTQSENRISLTNSLENTNLVLLSNNVLLAECIKDNVQSANGKFDKLARIDSFEQQLNAKYLKAHKVDLLIVDSDMALKHLELISQQIQGLPQSLQPKLMVLQSAKLSYHTFGFYSQSEQLLCKDNFLQNIQSLLSSEHSDNALYPKALFAENQPTADQLSLLLGVHSPQHAINLYRLLQYLGFQVQVVADEQSQKMLWQTGQYSLLITEFTQSALLEMAQVPVVDIGVFSLTETVFETKNNATFEHWHQGKLTIESTVAELTATLAPWLKQPQQQPKTVSNIQVNNDDKAILDDESSEQFVITEVAQVYSENNNDAVFDFSQYLQHQGSVELALFMLDEYTQENHQQLDLLVEAIKAKNIEEAQLAISVLRLNAKILSAPALQSLCVQWSKLLTGNEIPTSLKKINALLKDTRLTLTEIDEYAETV